jgi:precorrin-6A/cobalt-precorrin-6A reductase
LTATAGLSAVPSKRILILGGTGEARRLAALLHERGIEVVTSLAGLTREPELPNGTTRYGGFGGVDGLAAYLMNERFDALVDATHPFAAGMSQHAAEAATRCGVPILRLERPPWTAGADDQWHDFADCNAAAAALPKGARVLLTTGRKDLAAFFSRPMIAGVARMIEPPAIACPPGWRLIFARPPFTLGEELSLMERERITVLVAKNSGGADTRAKLDAARQRAIPVYLIQRPRKPDTAVVTAPEAALPILAALVGA